MPDFAFNTTPKDFPWWNRRRAPQVIADIKAMYRQKALKCLTRYGSGHGILYEQGQVLTADVIDTHFGAVAPWRT